MLVMILKRVAEIKILIVWKAPQKADFIDDQYRLNHCQ